MSQHEYHRVTGNIKVQYKPTAAGYTTVVLFGFVERLVFGGTAVPQCALMGRGTKLPHAPPRGILPWSEEARASALAHRLLSCAAHPPPGT